MTSCWGITDGSAGMVAQVKSLALAMGVEADMKTISLKRFWKFLPNICYDSPLKKCVLPYAVSDIEHIPPPYPDIIISCGRKAALVLAAIKRDEPRVKAICIQDPQMSAKNFDVVVAMQHDKIKGKNVIKTLFALHSITPEVLSKAKEKFAPVFANYPKPHIAVLIGGSTNKYSFSEEHMQLFIAELKEWLVTTKASLLITPSRRTGEGNIKLLEGAFAHDKNVYLYDMKVENTYMGMLACADEIIVSNDSVNMMTEAFATGKKVTIIELEGHEGTKPARFAEMVKHHPPLSGNEMQKLAAEVKKILDLRVNVS